MRWFVSNSSWGGSLMKICLGLLVISFLGGQIQCAEAKKKPLATSTQKTIHSEVLEGGETRYRTLETVKVEAVKVPLKCLYVRSTSTQDMIPLFYFVKGFVYPELTEFVSKLAEKRPVIVCSYLGSVQVIPQIIDSLLQALNIHKCFLVGNTKEESELTVIASYSAGKKGRISQFVVTGIKFEAPKWNDELDHVIKKMDHEGEVVINSWDCFYL